MKIVLLATLLSLFTFCNCGSVSDWKRRTIY